MPSNGTIHSYQNGNLKVLLLKIGKEDFVRKRKERAGFGASLGGRVGDDDVDLELK